MKKGFERLRHVAVAGSMSLGLLGGGSARAATAGLAITRTAGSAKWSNIKNTNLVTSSTSTITTSKTNGFSITSSLTGFAINNAGLTNSLNNAFSGALYMAAALSGNTTTTAFQNPDNTVDLTGDTLTTDLVTNFITGIDAQIEYFFHPTRPLVRALYSFTNNTNNPNPIIFDALIAGNLGSGSATTIQTTSNDDTTVETTDLWLISNNKALNTDPGTGDTPVITISRFGTGAAVSPANGITLGTLAGTFGHRYTLTVAANSTARILVFAELNKTITDAKICAKDFETLDAASSAGLLSGFTVQLNEIVNYAAATGASVTSTCIHTAAATTTSDNGSTTTTTTTDTTTNTSTDTSSSSNTSTTTTNTTEDLSTGALDLASITTLLGLLGLARIRKRKNHPED